MKPLPLVDENVLGAKGGSYALLIANSSYTNGWQRLETIPQEVSALKAVLLQHGFEVEVVRDPQGRGLRDAFESFIGRHGYDPDKRLLFYFAGHGHTRRDKSYLVPVDAPLPAMGEGPFLAKSMSLIQIRAWAAEMDAKHVLFLFDSCFSGAILGRAIPEGFRSSAAPAGVRNYLEHPVRHFITAGSASEQVPARSVFTPLLVAALRGAADENDDGYVTGTELGTYLHEEVLSRNLGQTPQQAKLRVADKEGEFVFALRSLERPAVAGSTPRPQTQPPVIEAPPERPTPAPPPAEAEPPPPTAPPAGEPSEAEMKAAAEAQLAARVMEIHRRVAKCKAIDGKPDPVVAMSCLPYLVPGMELDAKLESFEKISCEKAFGQAGYVCDYSLTLSSTSSLLGPYLQSFGGGHVDQARFVRHGTTWLMLTVASKQP